jgi:hypothetical protein
MSWTSEKNVTSLGFTVYVRDEIIMVKYKLTHNHKNGLAAQYKNLT